MYQQVQDCRTGLISCLDPNHLRRMAKYCREFLKIRIARNNDEIICFGVLPNLVVAGLLESRQDYLGRSGLFNLKERHQPAREVFIKQQLHSTATV